MPSLSNHFCSLVLVTFAVLVTASGAVEAVERPTVEVFTSIGLPIDTDFKSDETADTVDVYEIDGIERFESGLSRGLPDDHRVAKRIALERVGRVAEVQIQRVQRAALGLTKAMQYGLDRYPAIVFDGQAVVFGVDDVREAIDRYRQWQEAAGR